MSKIEHGEERPALTFEVGDRVCYRSDRAPGTVVHSDCYLVVVKLDDGEKGYLHPDDAAKVLDRLTGKDGEG